ncbi:ArnT family glycosyltransferase [Butyrivibrio sp. NC2002]|uniref:ArnT family glycosyltransferase n=1 Tax=Butyrivibrio sp. NC2002 TaxID=1410610 RepID=UPI0005605307|nr:glycosyltransferase family 39 protein [Butyrivibrio sp. NC2002]
MTKRKLSNTIWIMITIVFVGLCIYMLFKNLGEGYLIQTDEAYHATNVYEMYKQGNWLINTYRYATDYFNSKPPLVLDIMILSFKVLGVSGFAARFPSAIGGLFTLIAVMTFLLYKKKRYAAALYPILFCACTPLFSFHMYRAAEMDAWYNFFFVLAMLSLYLMEEHPNFMYCYGLNLGLAFMCKGPHAALIFLIGLLYIPKIHKAFKSAKRVVISVILASIMPIAWMIKRAMFDGTNLLKALFLGEVTYRVSQSKQFVIEPISDFFKLNVCFIFYAVLVIGIILWAGDKKYFTGSSLTGLKNFLGDNYLFILWIATPLVFFTVTGSFLTWYTYTSQIAMCIFSAVFGEWCIKVLGRDRMLAKALVVAAIIGFSLWFVVPCIRDVIAVAGKGGHPVDNFTNDIKEFREEYGDSYADYNAYLIADWRINYADLAHWEPEYVAPAEMYGNLICVEGTIDNFLADPHSILILDKNKWDEYSQILTGHVILHDNSYLIFSSDMY